MPNILIRSEYLDVDIRSELEKFAWHRAKWTSDKLIAASCFRYDKTPSFFVLLGQHGEYPAGTWGDSGSYDAEWASGNFIKLLAYLRNETYEETEEYLAGEYGWHVETGDTITLKPINLRIQRSRQSLNADILAKFIEDYTYLNSRGINEETQRQMGVLYDREKKAAVIPWRIPNGQLANVKYRKTFGKTFWYERGGWPIRELVYGIEKAQPTTVICEAEIDALSWQTAGVASIAVGGASFNSWKRDLILRSPIEELIIATDNDKAGGKLRREIEVAMKGHVRIRQAYVPEDVKDANEALMKYGADALREAVEEAESVRNLCVNLRRKD
jgi:DNA primase